MGMISSPVKHYNMHNRENSKSGKTYKIGVPCKTGKTGLTSNFLKTETQY